MNTNSPLKVLQGYTKRIKIMEVCGTHTSAIMKNGIKSIISPGIELVSGPGCPVCVTSRGVIDGLVSYAANRENTILTFGDMLHVKGSEMSLAEAKAMGGDVQIIYSPFEAVNMAESYPGRTFIIAAVGFETIIPIYGALLEQLISRSIENIKLYTSLKTMPPILDYICTYEAVDAFLCPGHVSVIIGSDAYNGLWEKYKKPFVVAGFEAAHILSAIYEIIMQYENNDPRVTNLYTEAVADSGQKRALEMIDKYFAVSDAYWRGIGAVSGSGYELKGEYSRFSANKAETEIENEDFECCCKEVMLGRISPNQCAMFKKKCTPKNPIGACMVSSEGACRTWYTLY